MKKIIPIRFSGCARMGKAPVHRLDRLDAHGEHERDNSPTKCWPKVPILAPAETELAEAR